MSDEKAKPDQQQRPWAEISSAELDAVYAVPAAAANRIIATNFPNGIRLTFGEFGMGRSDTNYRSAVFMSFEDALSLADLLQRQIEIAFPRADGGQN